MIVALVKLHSPNFEATNAKTLYANASFTAIPCHDDTQHSGITLSLTFLCFVFATLPTRWLARINSAMTYFQTCGYLVVLIGLPAAVVARPSEYIIGLSLDHI